MQEGEGWREKARERERLNAARCDMGVRGVTLMVLEMTDIMTSPPPVNLRGLGLVLRYVPGNPLDIAS